MGRVLIKSWFSAEDSWLLEVAQVLRACFLNKLLRQIAELTRFECILIGETALLLIATLAFHPYSL